MLTDPTHARFAGVTGVDPAGQLKPNGTPKSLKIKTTFNTMTITAPTFRHNASRLISQAIPMLLTCKNLPGDWSPLPRRALRWRELATEARTRGSGRAGNALGT